MSIVIIGHPDQRPTHCGVCRDELGRYRIDFSIGETSYISVMPRCQSQVTDDLLTTYRNENAPPEELNHQPDNDDNELLDNEYTDSEDA